ncbi:hypothetical protein IAU60_000279 [Kwoniella sp. DSM 27419]
MERPQRAAAMKQTAAGPLSDDDYDDLDDLVDELQSEDENGEVKDKKPKFKGGEMARILKGKLQKPRHVSISTKSLHEMIHMGGVELNPSYQRDVVWPPLKMISLIQSLMLNYYIPPILFSIEDGDDDRGEIRICLDGKQRCTSIQQFMDGLIPFISPATGERFWYTKFGTNKKGRQMPDSMKRDFDMIQLMAIEYDRLPDDTQRDLFQRVQLGVALSAAEKLQAVASPWATWILELEKRYILEPGTLGQLLSWENRRGKPFQNLLGLIMLVIEPNKAVKPTAATMKHFISRSDTPEEGFKARVQMTLSLFVDLATRYFNAAFKTVNARVAPVEFWYIGYLIYTRMGNLSLATIASQIGTIRKMVHGAFEGHVFTNNQVTAFLLTNIKALPKKRKADERPAAEEYEGDEDVDARNVRAMKRSRRGEEEDPTYVGERTERTLLTPERVQTRNQATSRVGSPTPTGSASRAGSRQADAVASNPADYHQLPTPVTAGTLSSSQWPHDQPMSAEQMRAYTEARARLLTEQEGGRA